MSDSKEKEFRVEDAIRRIEEINSLLQSGSKNLNESIELYKEGTLLVAQCKEALAGVEKQLKEISLEE